MSAPILVTKLFIPATRPELVRRQRLIDRLNGGLHQKLTLVSAPAGFGKTTLVTEWLNELQEDPPTKNQREKKITWLSIDEGDNDPTRFITYLIAALNKIYGGYIIHQQGQQFLNILIQQDKQARKTQFLQ